MPSRTKVVMPANKVAPNAGQAMGVTLVNNGTDIIGVDEVVLVDGETGYALNAVTWTSMGYGLIASRYGIYDEPRAGLRG